MAHHRRLWLTRGERERRIAVTDQQRKSPVSILDRSLEITGLGIISEPEVVTYQRTEDHGEAINR